VPVPGVGTVTVPGSRSVRAMLADFVPNRVPGPDKWKADVDSLEAELLPVLEELEVSYYLLHEGPCRIIEYSRGDFSDQDDCQ
jgi:hypothetical protein